jgi:hypothetical protein
MSVQPSPLGHQHERTLPSTLEARPVAEAELEAVDDLLDDGVDRDGQLSHGALRQTAAAGLVPRKALPVEQEHARACPSQPQRRSRAGRPGPHDDRVEALHRSMVRKNPLGNRVRVEGPSAPY